MLLRLLLLFVVNHGAGCSLKPGATERLQIDETLKEMQAMKSKNAGGSGPSAAQSAADLAAEGLRLRSEMQRAVEEER